MRTHSRGNHLTFKLAVRPGKIDAIHFERALERRPELTGTDHSSVFTCHAASDAHPTTPGLSHVLFVGAGFQCTFSI